MQSQPHEYSLHNSCVTLRPAHLRGSQWASPGVLLANALEGFPCTLQVLSPQRRVVFLDTDGVTGAAEDADVGASCNDGEAALLLRVAGAMVAAGLPAAALGAMSPYRAQARL